LKHISRHRAYKQRSSNNRQPIIMSQAATTQVKKVKGEGFKWGQELLKAKAIIAEQREVIEDLSERNEQLGHLVRFHKIQEGHIINQHNTKDCLYWGATNGYLTIWRLPKSVNVHDDCDFGDAFGNKWCLGEEWGGLMHAECRTITQKMIDKENFEDEDECSASEDEEEDLECAAWCKPISEGREPEERDADEFLSTKQKCPSCELERQEILKEKQETVHEMAVRIIAEQVKKQEENGEAEASNETEEGCCTNCNVFLDEDAHIFCFSKGEEEETMCQTCGEDLHEELKADGWLRDDDEGYEDAELKKRIAAYLQIEAGSRPPLTIQVYGLDALKQ